MGEETKPAETEAVEVEEEKKPEEKVEEEPKPPSPVVLYVDLHCVGCAKKIERSIFNVRGVEGVVIDMAQNQVTIKGIVDPQAVCNRIIKKTKRRAKILSPSLPQAAEGDTVPQVVKSQVTEATTVELNVNMHCEACADQLKTKILKMRGVQTATTELSTGKVTVTGTMDAEKLVDYVYRRTKKQATIVPQPQPEPKPEPEPEKKEEEKPPQEEPKPAPEEDKKPAAEEEKKEAAKEEPQNNNKEEEPKKEESNNEVISTIDEEHMKRMVYYYQPLYVIEQIPPPQLFSDENPNACSIS